MNNFSREDIVVHTGSMTLEWVYSSTDSLSEIFPELSRDLHVHFATVKYIVGAYSSPKIAFVLYKIKEVVAYVITSIPDRETGKNRILSVWVLKDQNSLQEAIDRIIEEENMFHPIDSENARIWLAQLYLSCPI